ncbi:helix-turn-helix transcriptional regulator [Sphaerotilus uruguayifluvii]|uniref:DNA-binding transcriptional regulator AlpA n=1 Tax=Sphaerotilus uruguayifluvii TaxID=2735897 RepID=A0ABX2G1P1_9BURK|nr:AlpA family phage regulatory protein [Leptothrix sp. C29]NRT55192.1 putative DNA-binding transcriptional regulator AlpA [Leptothrix sp. C29]
MKEASNNSNSNSNTTTGGTSPVQFLSVNDVMALTRTGRTWLYARMKDEVDPFPAPVRFSPRCVRWSASEVNAWMGRRVDGKSADLVEQAKGGA